MYVNHPLVPGRPPTKALLPPRLPIRTATHLPTGTPEETLDCACELYLSAPDI